MKYIILLDPVSFRFQFTSVMKLNTKYFSEQLEERQYSTVGSLRAETSKSQTGLESWLYHQMIM